MFIATKKALSLDRAFTLLFKNYIHLILIDGIGRNNSAHAGSRIDIGAAAHNGTGVEHAVAANLNIVAKDCTYLAAAGLNGALGILDGDIGLVTLYIAGD